MVQVFDSFIKMYGRAPTEDEIVKMMKLKAEMEKKVNPHMQKPHINTCLLYTSPSPRDGLLSRMPSSA